MQVVESQSIGIDTHFTPAKFLGVGAMRGDVARRGQSARALFSYSMAPSPCVAPDFPGRSGPPGDFLEHVAFIGTDGGSDLRQDVRHGRGLLQEANDVVSRLHVIPGCRLVEGL